MQYQLMHRRAAAAQCLTAVQVLPAPRCVADAHNCPLHCASEGFTVVALMHHAKLQCVLTYAQCCSCKSMYVLTHVSMLLLQARSRSLRLDIDDVTTHVDPHAASALHTPAASATHIHAGHLTRHAHDSHNRDSFPEDFKDSGKAVGGAYGHLQWHGSLQELEQLAERFAQNVPDGAVSPAALQGFLMKHKRSPAAAAADAHELA